MRHRSTTFSKAAAATVMLFCVTPVAGAASLVNKDSESRTLVVTEGGVKNEVAVAGGETVTFCKAGCFLTLPDGDRAALAGSETVEIVNGEAFIR